jgi:hypothetical protein
MILPPAIAVELARRRAGLRGPYSVPPEAAGACAACDPPPGCPNAPCRSCGTPGPAVIHADCPRGLFRLELFA